VGAALRAGEGEAFPRAWGCRASPCPGRPAPPD